MIVRQEMHCPDAGYIQPVDRPALVLLRAQQLLEFSSSQELYAASPTRRRA
jgi:hypothetical protein